MADKKGKWTTVEEALVVLQQIIVFVFGDDKLKCKDVEKLLKYFLEEYGEQLPWDVANSTHKLIKTRNDCSHNPLNELTLGQKKEAFKHIWRLVKYVEESLAFVIPADLLNKIEKLEDVGLMTVYRNDYEDLRSKAAQAEPLGQLAGKVVPQGIVDCICIQLESKGKGQLIPLLVKAAKTERYLTVQVLKTWIFLEDPTLWSDVLLYLREAGVSDQKPNSTPPLEERCETGSPRTHQEGCDMGQHDALATRGHRASREENGLLQHPGAANATAPGPQQFHNKTTQTDKDQVRARNDVFHKVVKELKDERQMNTELRKNQKWYKDQLEKSESKVSELQDLVNDLTRNLEAGRVVENASPEDKKDIQEGKLCLQKPAPDQRKHRKNKNNGTGRKK